MEMKEKNQDEFEKYKLEVAESVSAVQKKISEEKDNRKLVDFDSYPSEELKAEVIEVVKESIDVQDVGAVGLSVPPAHISGDFALEVFDLAKKLGEKPNVLAKKIADRINERELELIKDASVAGAFVNVETQKETLYRDILAKVLELGERYGESDINAGKVAVIDYSAPNIAKPIGVGHLRSTIIGQALVNLYHETGYSVIKDNHLGDWGTQFGSLIYAYKEWGDEKKIEENPIRELKNLYIKFHAFSEEHPEVKDNARELFTRLEKKDPELVALWKRFRDLSLKDFERVYRQLGIEFDTNIGESYFTEQTDKLVDECMASGLCRKDEASEAVVVDQMGEIPSFLLRKQDGSSLYLSRDLATLQFRVNTFKPNAILYVVGNEQDLNFKQLFALGKRAEYLPDEVETKHIGFGMVLRDGKKMSTRKGTLIELEDLLSQSVEKSKEILLKKNSDADPQELDKVAEIVGIGAIIYNDLRQSRVKNISFDWDKMLDLEGGSAVYLQYSYVRINSILRKLTETYGEIDLSTLEKGEIFFESKSEFGLAKKLMMFPETILRSQQSDSPHQLCVYLEELALLFNSFYNEVSLLRTEDTKLRESRVALCEGVALVIKKGLSLLSIKVPEKM
ncbi:MAG: Arginine-tRNA ligase [Candidatus Moranbacteria bacterium GW2011_GWF2_35_39]|nr:MAG: Arginine-tRNA ligase [Candidatus Moranbacteria bacterium GW2011_GWF2_35_39]